jgi:hypothetical protein
MLIFLKVKNVEKCSKKCPNYADIFDFYFTTWSFLSWSFNVIFQHNCLLFHYISRTCNKFMRAGGCFSLENVEKSLWTIIFRLKMSKNLIEQPFFIKECRKISLSNRFSFKNLFERLFFILKYQQTPRTKHFNFVKNSCLLLEIDRRNHFVTYNFSSTNYTL